MPVPIQKRSVTPEVSYKALWAHHPTLQQADENPRTQVFCDFSPWLLLYFVQAGTPQQSTKGPGVLRANTLILLRIRTNTLQTPVPKSRRHRRS